MESYTSNPAGSLKPFLIWLLHPVPVVNAHHLCKIPQQLLPDPHMHILEKQAIGKPLRDLDGFYEKRKRMMAQWSRSDGSLWLVFHSSTVFSTWLRFVTALFEMFLSRVLCLKAINDEKRNITLDIQRSRCNALVKSVVNTLNPH